MTLPELVRKAGAGKSHVQRVAIASAVTAAAEVLGLDATQELTEAQTEQLFEVFASVEEELLELPPYIRPPLRLVPG